MYCPFTAVFPQVSSGFQVQSRASLDRAQAAEEEQAKWQDKADQLREQLRPWTAIVPQYATVLSGSFCDMMWHGIDIIYIYYYNRFNRLSYIDSFYITMYYT